MPKVGKDRFVIPHGERRTAYRALTDAMEWANAACDVTTITGIGWDDIPVALQKKVCKKCPLLEPCKAYAETDPANTHGVWGGTLYPRHPDAVRAAARLEKQAQRAKKEPK